MLTVETVWPYEIIRTDAKAGLVIADSSIVAFVTHIETVRWAPLTSRTL